MRIPTILLAAAVCCASLPAAAQDFNWHGSVAQGSTIEIRGINGDVRAEPSGGNDVEVVAQKHGRHDDPSTVRVEMIHNGGDVVICAVYPSEPGQPANECRAGGGKMNVQNNDVSVTFVVKVPAGVRFSGHTVNGDVQALRLNGDVALSTVNGSADFSTTASGRASTVNGSIHGEMGRADWTDTMSMSTVNGSIVLTLPPDLSTDLRFTTVNGDVSTDFPMTVSRSSRRRVEGTIGGGGRVLALDTVNGSVTIKRS